MNLDQLRASRSAVITIAEAASLLRVDQRTARRACETGQIASLTIGRRVLVVREKLLATLTESDEQRKEAPAKGAETPAGAASLTR